MADRADKLLHEQNIFESRKKAQVAIAKGLVTHRRGAIDTRIVKPSQIVDWREGDSWQVQGDEEFLYVSRAGAKLAAALTQWSLSAENKVVLDVGLSTGGFSDCLLQRKARWILGLDVGHGQLHQRLQQEPRLKSLEKYNAKETLGVGQIHLLESFTGQTQFDWMVFDVSFISVDVVLRAQWSHLKSGGVALVLFKPQFEAGREALDKKGVVSQEQGLRVLQKTVKTWNDDGYTVVDTFMCPLRGEDGNQEYFVYLQK